MLKELEFKQQLLDQQPVLKEAQIEELAWQQLLTDEQLLKWMVESERNERLVT